MDMEDPKLWKKSANDMFINAFSFREKKLILERENTELMTAEEEESLNKLLNSIKRLDLNDIESFNELRDTIDDIAPIEETEEEKTKNFIKQRRSHFDGVDRISNSPLPMKKEGFSDKVTKNLLKVKGLTNSNAFKSAKILTNIDKKRKTGYGFVHEDRYRE